MVAGATRAATWPGLPRRIKAYWVVAGDIRGCFVALARDFLRAGVMERVLFRRTEEGLPQGAVITPPSMLLTGRTNSSFASLGGSGSVPTEAAASDSEAWQYLASPTGVTVQACSSVNPIDIPTPPQRSGPSVLQRRAAPADRRGRACTDLDDGTLGRAGNAGCRLSAVARASITRSPNSERSADRSACDRSSMRTARINW